MVSTDQSWATTSFVQQQDIGRSPIRVTKFYWLTTRKSTNSVFLLGKNPHILTAPATTRKEGFLSLCSTKEQAMWSTAIQVRPKRLSPVFPIRTSSRGENGGDISSPI